ncbi:MAG: diguanylate cyclase [Mariprofundaceae bacterium]
MTNLSTAEPTDIAHFFEAVGAGIVVFDVNETNALRLVCTNRIYRSMYGIEREPDAGCSIHDFLPRYIQKHYRQQFQDCSELKETVDYELPLEFSGKSYWFRVRMVPVFADDSDVITRIFATNVDITQQKVLEEELAILSTRLEAIVDSTYDAIVSIDDKHDIKTFNQAAEELFGFDREEVVGKNMEMLLPQGSRAPHAGHIDSFRKSPVNARPMETRVEVTGLRSDGTSFPAEVAIAKISVHGEMEFTAVVRDISVQVRLLEELKQRATTDPLTGISNRRHLVEVAEMEIERCERYEHPLSLLLLDIDDFKSVNDTYGHSVGDSVLRELGAVLKKHSRKLDVPARWGGEEFCLLIPETKTEGALELCNRLLEDIRGVHHNIPELKDRVVTASIGLAAYHKGDADVDKFVTRADEAMYEAKNSGKNKVCLAP